MDRPIIPLSELSPRELQSVAALHCAVMPTLLTDLGLTLTQRYYEIAARDPAVIGFASLAADDSATGWVVGSADPAKLAARLRRPLGGFARRLALLTLTRPRVILQLARTVLLPVQENIIQPGEIELTYIGVAESARGQGLGAELARRFCAASAAAGYKRVSLSVETENEPAIRLYRRLGFETVKEFREGKFHRLRMRVKLS
ncbi:MAG: GNAT family N-acetyltransferase [Chloroflexi bacterium]|nr:GNAT family N-acetyltransferase [Chloroflexota bacterium]